MSAALTRGLRIALVMAAAGGCGGDGIGAPAQPTTIEILSAVGITGTAGTVLSSPVTFRVMDQFGSPMAGVPVSIAVQAGGGSLAGAPTHSSAQALSVGAWTLGQVVGENRITVTVAGIAPAIFNLVSRAGASAKFIDPTGTSLTGIVGGAVTPAPGATLVDAFNNPIGFAPVSITVTGGGTAADQALSSPTGRVQLPVWTLGTTVGTQTLTFTAGPAVITFTAVAAPAP